MSNTNIARIAVAHARIAVAHAQLSNIIDDVQRIRKDEDCHGDDAAGAAMAIGSGLVFSLFDFEVESKALLAHTMRAQGHLIECTRKQRISWRRSCTDMALGELTKALELLEQIRDAAEGN